MAYISSNANRWYCAQETAYGQVPTITAANRIPAVKLSVQNQRQKSHRKDKTGSRTWAGLPAAMRRETTFDATTYMRDWPLQTALPGCDPLLQAALGGAGVLWPGGTTAAAGSTTSTIVFAGAHGLAPGSGLVYNSEIRFVASVTDAHTVVLNAPFSSAPRAASVLTPTASYAPASELPSVSLFDYWNPTTAVQRVLTGVAIDRFTVSLNGDFHEFGFKGWAQDVMDSASFAAGQGGLTTFPIEPATTAFPYSPVPGNLGQVWLGVSPTQFFTVAQASIELRNNLDMRLNEFGSVLPRGIAPGAREVSLSLELFEQDDTPTAALYQAARQQTPVSMMFQLGQTNGQLMGIWMKNVVPEVPAFDDSEHRLKWKFSESRAQGGLDDELMVAFG